jgi:hypothetical protein
MVQPEARLAEMDHRLGGRARSGVVDEHDVRIAQDALAARSIERRRQRDEAAFEEHEVGLIRDDADRQRYGSQSGRRDSSSGLGC